MAVKAHKYCENIQMLVQAECKVPTLVMGKESVHQVISAAYLRTGNRFKVAGDLSYEARLARESRHFDCVVDSEALIIASLKINQRGFTRYEASTAPLTMLSYVLDNPFFGGAMDGYFPGTGGGPFPLLVDSGQGATIRTEHVGREPCVVVAGTLSNGRATIWLAKERGFLLRKFVAVLENGPVSIIASLENTEFQRIGETEVPTKAILTFPKRQYVYVRKQIALNPIWARSAFRIDIPMRSEVKNLDERASGVHYTFQDGKLVPLYEDFKGGATLVAQEGRILFHWSLGCAGALLLGIGLRHIVRRRARTATLLGLSGLLFWPSLSRGQEFDSYSGVQAAARAARAYGKDVSFGSLVKSDYISLPWGSSTEDLVRAITDLGFSATVKKNMSAITLQTLSCPVLLHVKRTNSITGYGSWVLFVGSMGSKVVVYEGFLPDSSLVEWRELAARWDGLGILVETRQSADYPWDTMVVVTQWSFMLGVVVALYALSLQVFDRLSRALHIQRLTHVASLEIICIFLVALALLLSFKCFHVEGFLSSATAIEDIQANQLCIVLPRVRRCDLDELFKRQHLVIVDGRHPTEYAKDHFENSISIPFVYGLDDVDRLLPAADRATTTVLLRCDSDQSYSILARKLQTLGYGKLLLFQRDDIAED